MFDDAVWCAGPPPAPGPCSAKTRYRQQDAACVFEAGDAPGQFRLRFEQPQWAVTPGQSAVLYDGEVCLGGGVIASAGLESNTQKTAETRVDTAIAATKNAAKT